VRFRIAPALLAGAMLFTGCSGGGGNKQARSTTTTTTPAERVASTKVADPREFCSRLSAVITSTAQIGTETQLAQVKKDLGYVSQQLDADLLDGTPVGSGTFPAYLALDNDMRAVNAWIQTKATQDDLDHNRQPADVRARFNDLGVQFRALQAWSTPKCKAFGGGDNS
jgi:hypothetical protein